VGNADLLRELTKVHDTLLKVQAHLYHKDAMNANLHMSDKVLSTPLYSAVEKALETTKSLMGTLMLEED